METASTLYIEYEAFDGVSLSKMHSLQEAGITLISEKDCSDLAIKLLQGIECFNASNLKEIPLILENILIKKDSNFKEIRLIDLNVNESKAKCFDYSYQLGLLLYDLLVCNNQIKKAKGTQRVSSPGCKLSMSFQISLSAQSFVSMLLYCKHSSLTELINHPWVKEDVVSIVSNPKKIRSLLSLINALLFVARLSSKPPNASFYQDKLADSILMKASPTELEEGCKYEYKIIKLIPVEKNLKNKQNEQNVSKQRNILISTLKSIPNIEVFGTRFPNINGIIKKPLLKKSTLQLPKKTAQSTTKKNRSTIVCSQEKRERIHTVCPVKASANCSKMFAYRCSALKQQSRCKAGLTLKASNSYHY